MTQGSLATTPSSTSTLMYSFCPNTLLPGPFRLPISLILLRLCPFSQPTQKFTCLKLKQYYARLGLQYYWLCWPIFQWVISDLQQAGYYDILLRDIPGKYSRLVCLHGSLLLVVGVYVETVRKCCLLMEKLRFFLL